MMPPQHGQCTTDWTSIDASTNTMFGGIGGAVVDENAIAIL
jgi:hypothetical protein